MENCVSPPYVEIFNSKLIKRFRTWTRSRYVFSNSEIPMFYRYQHYLSISQIAVSDYATLSPHQHITNNKVYVMLHSVLIIILIFISIFYIPIHQPRSHLSIRLYIYIYIYISMYGWRQLGFLFKLLKWRHSRFLIIFLMSRSSLRSKSTILA